ncbi:MAG TPA: hypothetical protein VM535_01940 [Candidatus Saccharimonadales bacterium]|nr:hypothetical protein [Candidatus Saccharimonadales bacterium]
MYDFLVLGLIPGTNIQIGFWTWIIIMLALTIGLTKYREQIERAVKNWWHQFDDDEMVEGRQPLPANRLHLRGL